MLVTKRTFNSPNVESFFGQRRKPYHLFSTLWEVGEFGVYLVYTFGVSMRTFTKQTQCHLADGVKDGGEDLVRVKLLDISFYKLECVML